MTPYVSRTGSGRTLAALHAHGWRLLVNAYGAHRHEGFGYMIDPGTVEAHKASEGGIRHRAGWEEQRFVKVVERLGRGADMIVAPDIVRGGNSSLRLSEWWLPWVSEYAMPLIAVQDGMAPEDIWPLVGPSCGIFVGGSTEWKWQTLPQWAGISRARGCHLHVGRVNSYMRISTATILGAHSVDGTCALFSVNIPKLTNAVRQQTIEGIR